MSHFEKFCKTIPIQSFFFNILGVRYRSEFGLVWFSVIKTKNLNKSFIGRQSEPGPLECGFAILSIQNEVIECLDL